MSLLRQARRRAAARNQVDSIDGPFDKYTTLPSHFASDKVSQTRAMQLSTVWACVNLKAETIGGLPVDVVEYDGPNRIVKKRPTWLEKPNPETTGFELMERTSASLDVDGNAFWYYERDRIKRIAEVWVLPPAAVKVDREESRDGRRGRKVFTFGNEEFYADNILHIPGFSLAGRLRGLNPIDQHAHTLGLAVAAEEFGESFFRNGAVMSGVIEHPGEPEPKVARRMRRSFARDHSGRNAHLPGMLFGGAKWTQLTIANDNAQFLETRQFQRSEICSIFRTPPHKIGDLSRATYSNIEHQGIEWATDGVSPRTTRIQSAVLAGGLLDIGEHLRFKLNGLYRGDIATRYLAYAVGRQWGWLSADDVLAFEDENPLPGGIGQTYLEPLNMVPAGERPDDPTKALALIVEKIRAGEIEFATAPREA